VEADIPALAVLMEELDRFYGATKIEPIVRREEQIRAAILGPHPAAYALLAKDGQDVIGLAAYSFLWPAAGVTTSLFLKELYVRQDRHSQGVGRRLMQAVADVAVDAGCSRVEWQTEDGNERAKEFYRSLGAPLHAGKVFYRLEGEGLRQLAEDFSRQR
jgi:GNAT superfamily N-acetyltransferase